MRNSITKTVVAAVAALGMATAVATISHAGCRLNGMAAAVFTAAASTAFGGGGWRLGRRLAWRLGPSRMGRRLGWRRAGWGPGWGGGWGGGCWNCG